MIKKLFLFTLLVSSFLVISCSNKDTTAPTTVVIDSKWYGTYKYSATTETGVSVESTITVSENGISIYETENGKTVTADFLNKQLKKISDNVYQTEELSGPSYIKFEFASTDTGATLTVTDYINGQASTPEVHTKISTLIDSKWYGTYKYSATTETGVSVESTITVSENGISIYETENGKPVTADFLNSQLKKVSDNVYQTEELSGPSYIKFEFASTSTSATLTVTDYINGQASTPEVYNKQ